MKQKGLKLCSLFLLGLGLTNLDAQQANPASGGNALGSGGTASYSVGIVAYTTETRAAGSVAQGVQHAWEIYTVGIFENEFEISVFPNPATSHITLQVPGFVDEKFAFRFYDMMGRLLESDILTSRQTHIHTGYLPPGIYILNVMRENKKVQSFKIIKH